MNNDVLENFLKQNYKVNNKDIEVYEIVLQKLLNIIVKEKDIHTQLQAIKVLLEEKKDYLKITDDKEKGDFTSSIKMEKNITKNNKNNKKNT